MARLELPRFGYARMIGMFVNSRAQHGGVFMLELDSMVCRLIHKDTAILQLVYGTAQSYLRITSALSLSVATA